MKVDIGDGYTGIASVISPSVDDQPVNKTDADSAISVDNDAEKVDQISQIGVPSDQDEERLVEMVEKVNQFAEIQKVSLRLRVDEETELRVVSIIDENTEEVIRQIPSEHAIQLAKNIDDAMKELFSSSPNDVMHFLSDQA